jgi:hypothetical protein
MTPQAALRWIKVTHTLVWAFFSACIFGISFFAWRGNYAAAALLIAIVLVEVAVLSLNQLVCPLTNLARRYTNDERANFDIYLPRWLARYNKVVFGALYAAGVVLTAFRWLITKIN